MILTDGWNTHIEQSQPTYTLVDTQIYKCFFVQILINSSLNIFTVS